jgi:uncharacterized protein (TIGR02118 family)
MLSCAVGPGQPARQAVQPRLAEQTNRERNAMIVTVTYHLGPDQNFDLDYYLSTHMPLVEKLWGPLGMTSAKVLRGTGTPTGAAAPIHIMALLEFESAAAFRAAGKEHGREVMGDIPNFTNAEAAVQFNDQIL